MKNRSEENTIIKKLRSNEEATMSQPFSNSAGMVILALQQNYLGQTPSQKEWDKFYSKCELTLRQLTIADFLKSDDTVEYTQTLESELERSLADSIDYILMRTNEQSNQFDCVTLYLLNENGTYSNVMYVFPLKYVFALVVKAHTDDARFVCRYEGSEEERLEKAKADKPLRLLSLFRCLKKIQQEGICHQGIRNALILLLNKSYEGVDLIEDPITTVFSFFREGVYKRFDAYYQQMLADNQVDGKVSVIVLFNALLVWMKEANSRPLLAIIDPTNEIKNDLLTCFVEHGVDVNSLTISGQSLSDYIDTVSENIDFDLGMEKYQFLHDINVVLNTIVSNESNNNRKDAVYKIQNWIETLFCLKTPEHRTIISDFLSIEQANKDLLQYQPLLILTNHATQDELRTIEGSIQTYYRNVIEHDDIIPDLSEQARSEIDNLDRIIKQFKDDKCVDTIEKFFVHWFGAMSEVFDILDNFEPLSNSIMIDGIESIPNQYLKQLNGLYSLLISKEFVRLGIELSDIDIQEMDALETRTEGVNVVRYKTVYEINRIFLHAIVIKSEQWSALFSKAFEQTLLFVKNNLDEGFIDRKVKKESYPFELVAQLEYLRDSRNYRTDDTESKTDEIVTVPIRPFHPICLPESIKDANEWIYYSAAMDENTRLKSYTIIKSYLEELLVSFVNEIPRTLPLMLFLLPKQEHRSFLKNPDIANLLKSFHALEWLLEKMPVIFYEGIFAVLVESDFFLLQVRYAMSEFEIKIDEDEDEDASLISKDAMDKLLNKFDDERKEKIMKKAFSLSDDSPIRLFDNYTFYNAFNFKKYMIIAGIDTKENFLKYQKLDIEKARLLSKLIYICFTYDLFDELSEASFDDDSEELFPRIWTLVDHQANYDSLLYAVNIISQINDKDHILDDEDNEFFEMVIFILFHSGLLSINSLEILSIDPGYMVRQIKIFKGEPPCRTIKVQNRLDDIRSRQEELASVLRFRRAFLDLNEIELQEFLKGIQSNILTIIPNSHQLGLLLQTLTETQCKILLDVMQYQLPEIISNDAELALALRNLNKTEYKALSKSMQSQFRIIIPASDKLGQILQYLNEMQFKIFLEIVRDQLSNIIRNGLELGLALQYLNKEQCQAFLEVIDVQLPLILCNSTQIKIVLLCLKEDTKKIVLERIHKQVLNVIAKEYDGNDVIAYLNNIEQNLFSIFPYKSVSRLKDNRFNMYTLLFDKISENLEENIISCDNRQVTRRHCEQQRCEAIQRPLSKGHWIAAPAARNDGLPDNSDGMQQLASNEIIYSDFIVAARKMVDLVKKLRSQGKITHEQSLDLMEKTNQLIQDPSLYKTFLTTAKGYDHVAGGKLSAYMMLICGWVAKIVALNYLGNDWINEAKRKLEQIKIVENVAECSQRKVKHANARVSFTFFRNSCEMGESDAGNRVAASEKGASFPIFS